MTNNRKPLSELLNRDTLIRMRQAGLTYAEIARQVDYCSRLVTDYAHTILPPELCGKQPKRNGNTPTHYLDFLICKRCQLRTEPRNPVDVTTRLCLLCRLDLAGINIPKAVHTGVYNAILKREQEKR